MGYDIWDTNSGNLVGGFASRPEALALIRDEVRTHGAHAVDTFALVRVDEAGASHLVAQGAALLELIQGPAPVAAGQDGEQGLPADLTAYVRGRAGYDYRHHAESGSSNAAFVDDGSVDRFCVIGEVRLLTVHSTIAALAL